jgi:chloramphenicol-sensitive protein RarD
MSPGLAYALIAFTIWGLFPLYLRQLASLSALEILLHRSVWSLPVVLALMGLAGRLGFLRSAFGNRRQLSVFVLSAALLAVNWFVYLLAVQGGRVLDASLGYFINPLVNVLLGVLVLRERLNRVQWLAVALAAAAVIWLTASTGSLPWYALALAASFGLYGLVRKLAPAGALEGLAVETLVLAPVMVPALLWWLATRPSAFDPPDPVVVAWVLASGPLTALPLLAFAAAARRLRLATLGLVQYLAPSLQFVLGVWVFAEPLQPARLAGFALIWLALVIYSVDAWRRLVPRAAAAA